MPKKHFSQGKRRQKEGAPLFVLLQQRENTYFQARDLLSMVKNYPK
jgi:hypothetical protein